MKRINKTKKNLQNVWDDLDMACGLLENSFNNLCSMSISDNIKNSMDQIDITAIVSLKNEIEELIE